MFFRDFSILIDATWTQVSQLHFHNSRLQFQHIPKVQLDCWLWRTVSPVNSLKGTSLRRLRYPPGGVHREGYDMVFNTQMVLSSSTTITPLAGIHVLMTPTPISDPPSKEIKDDQTQEKFFQPSILQFGESVWTGASVFRSEQTGALPYESSFAGEHLLPGWTCCIFRHGLLPTWAGTSGPWSSFGLSVT